MVDLASFYRAVQRTARDDQDLDGAVVVGFVAVVEWMAPDGEKWLSMVDSDVNRRRLASWTRQGYLHEALYNAGTFDEPEADDE